MLQKQDCNLAINEWEVAKKNYSRIKSLIDSKSVFCFNREALNWFLEKSANDYFHAYFGVFNNKLTMIVVPLNENGIELDLSSYLTVSMAPLAEDLELKELNTSLSYNKVTISKDWLISGFSENSETFPLSEPSISISSAITRIQTWSNIGLEWLQEECETYLGARIFSTFQVHSFSLANCNLNASKVYCFFGLKASENMLIPDLVFVAVSEGQELGNQNGSVMGILTDFVRPCPPFCEGNTNYTIFK